MFDHIEKNTFKLKEGLDDSWTNGEHTVTLRQLLIVTKDIPVTEFAIEKLKDISLHANNPDEQDRIDKSDLQYPVLIFINGNNTIKYIVDGHHRVQKTMLFNRMFTKTLRRIGKKNVGKLYSAAKRKNAKRRNVETGKSII